MKVKENKVNYGWKSQDFRLSCDPPECLIMCLRFTSMSECHVGTRGPQGVNITETKRKAIILMGVLKRGLFMKGATACVGNQNSQALNGGRES